MQKIYVELRFEWFRFIGLSLVAEFVFYFGHHYPIFPEFLVLEIGLFCLSWSRYFYAEEE